MNRSCKLIKRRAVWMDLTWIRELRIHANTYATRSFSLSLCQNATQVNGINVYAASTIGYVLYTFGQVFLFCIFGNRLIEEVRISLTRPFRWRGHAFSIGRLKRVNFALFRAPRWWKRLTPAIGTTARRRPKRSCRSCVSSVRKPCRSRGRSSLRCL